MAGAEGLFTVAVTEVEVIGDNAISAAAAAATPPPAPPTAELFFGFFEYLFLAFPFVFSST